MTLIGVIRYMKSTIETLLKVLMRKIKLVSLKMMLSVTTEKIKLISLFGQLIKNSKILMKMI